MNFPELWLPNRKLEAPRNPLSRRPLDNRRYIQKLGTAKDCCEGQSGGIECEYCGSVNTDDLYVEASGDFYWVDLGGIDIEFDDTFALTFYQQIGQGWYWVSDEIELVEIPPITMTIGAHFFCDNSHNFWWYGNYGITAGIGSLVSTVYTAAHHYETPSISDCYTRSVSDYGPINPGLSNLFFFTPAVTGTAGTHMPISQ